MQMKPVQIKCDAVMKSEIENLSADEQSVLLFLKNWPGVFISSTEIARRADGKNRYREDPRWSVHVLPQLMAANLVETDGHGKFRLKTLQTVQVGGRKRFISPHLSAILAKHGRKFQLAS